MVQHSKGKKRRKKLTRVTRKTQSQSRAKSAGDKVGMAGKKRGGKKRGGKQNLHGEGARENKTKLVQTDEGLLRTTKEKKPESGVGGGSAVNQKRVHQVGGRLQRRRNVVLLQAPNRTQ